MTKRSEVLKFGKLNGLQIKGESCRDSLVVTVFAPKTNWVDCFNSWEDVHESLLSAARLYRDQATPYPWAAR